MSKVKSTYPFLVLISGIALFGAGFVMRRQAGQAVKPIALKIVSLERHWNEGKVVLDATITRLQRGDGSYRELTTTYNPDGSIKYSKELMGIVGVGAFIVDYDKSRLIYRSARNHPAHGMDADAARKGPGYLGEDNILGIGVVRQNIDGAEIDRAPSLNGLPLRTIFDFGKGAKTIIEAVAIELREPTEMEFGALPDFPIDYGSYEKMIGIGRSLAAPPSHTTSAYGSVPGGSVESGPSRAL